MILCTSVTDKATAEQTCLMGGCSMIKKDPNMCTLNGAGNFDGSWYVENFASCSECLHIRLLAFFIEMYGQKLNPVSEAIAFGLRLKLFNIY